MAPATITPTPTPVAAQPVPVTAWVGATRLTAAKGITYEDVENDAGSASFTIHVDTDTAAQRALIDFRTLVTFKEFAGTADESIAFVMIVEDIAQTTVASGEEHDQGVTYSGRSVVAELDSALVYEPRGLFTVPDGPLASLILARQPWSDTRWWNYASVGLDRSSWTAATETIAQGQSPPLDPPYGYSGNPEAWPYPAVKFIVPDTGTGGYHTPRTWYTHGSFTSTETAEWVNLVAGAGVNDAINVWLDGVPMINSAANESGKAKRVKLLLTAGPHDIVAMIEHGGPSAAGNVTAFICALGPHFDGGGGWLDTPYISTTSAWTVLNNPATPPGYTPDEISAELIDEAIDRGAIPDWETDATGGTDSAGDGFVEVVEFSTRIGTKVFDAHRQLAETHAGFAADPATNAGRHLLLFNTPGAAIPGGGTAAGGGEDSGVHLEVGVNILELTHHDSTPQATSILGRWDGGWFEVDVWEDSDWGRLEELLSIPDTKHGPTAAYTAGSYVQDMQNPLESIDGLRHRLTPSTQYRVRDTVWIPNRAGTEIAWRCTSRAVETDDDGNGTVTAGFGERRDDDLARIDRWNRKLMGTVNGKLEAASPASPSIVVAETMQAMELQFSTGGSGVTLVGDRGTPQRPDHLMLATNLEIETDIPGASGSTTARVEIDGVSIGTVTLAVTADTGVAVLSPPLLIRKSNYVNIETTAAGGAQGITVRVKGCAVD